MDSALCKSLQEQIQDLTYNQSDGMPLANLAQAVCSSPKIQMTCYDQPVEDKKEVHK